jgi:hypothetical protein
MRNLKGTFSLSEHEIKQMNSLLWLFFAFLGPLPAQALDPHFHSVGICLQMCMVDLFRSDLNNVNEKIKGYFIGIYRTDM